MEVAALCIRLYSASLRVEPNKLQFFQYDSLTLHCEGLHGSTGWKFVHQFKGELKTSVTIKKTSAGLSCAYKNVYPEDSGAYWCESGWEERSNSVNITVTDGPVILESPALTVEGEAATLRCRNKTNSNFAADFYKDGRLIESSSTGEMIIHSVSESDEGLNKCRIPGAGESPESWLDIGISDPVSLAVVPNRQQFFEHESLTFYCEGFSGSAGWKVVHQFNGEVFWCRNREVTSSVLSCIIKSVSPEDSGAYWCEAQGGRRSNSINITVTSPQSTTETHPIPSSDQVFIILRNICPVMLMAMLFLLRGLLHCGNL